MNNFKYFLIFFIIFSSFFVQKKSFSENHDLKEILEIIQKDLKTLEKAVYSTNQSDSNELQISMDENSEDVLTRHLLKLSEIEKQFQGLTNKFEEVNFKLDKLSNRLSKVQADNQLRFQQLETGTLNEDILKKNKSKKEKILPGSSEPQDLGAISYKDTDTQQTVQEIQSVDTTGSVVTETFVSEEKILPETNPDEQYQFATSFLKNGDYNMAERAFREFVNSNPDHQLAGNAQYWYAETFRIRQLFTDAASAYLEGYQNIQKVRRLL